MKGAADAAHGTGNGTGSGTLRGDRNFAARVEGMRAGTSRFAEAGLRCRAADMAEAATEAMEATEVSGAVSVESSGPALVVVVASGCSTRERSGW